MKLGYIEKENSHKWVVYTHFGNVRGTFKTLREALKFCASKGLRKSIRLSSGYYAVADTEAVFRKISY